MITLRFNNLDNLILFDERYVNVIEISDKKLFKKITYILNKYSKSIEQGNDLILFENENRIEISKNLLVVNDFYNIDINSKKFLKLLYNDIEMQYNYEYGEENILINSEEIFRNLKDIFYNYDFEFEYKQELKVSDILKCIGIKLNDYYYDNPFDNLLFLFELINLFKVYKVVALINAKIFFTEEELIEIYKGALQRNINILLLEYGEESELLKYENKLYVDCDFDEFIFKK